jgi:hypothetical protein
MVRVLITLVTVALFLDLLGAGQYWCLSHAAPSAELIASRQFRAIYDLQELDTGNADGTVVYHGGGMSDSGTVVGETMAGDAGAPSATEWIDGRRIPLPTAGIASATALSINRRGEIAGYGSSGSGTTALLWCGGKPIELSPLHGFSSSIANAVSADGTVAGYSSDPSTSTLNVIVYGDESIGGVNTAGVRSAPRQHKGAEGPAYGAIVRKQIAGATMRTAPEISTDSAGRSRLDCLACEQA